MPRANLFSFVTFEHTNKTAVFLNLEIPSADFIQHFYIVTELFRNLLDNKQVNSYILIVNTKKIIIMSKAGLKQQLKGMRKIVQKVNHGPIIRTNIPSKMAIAGPPLGPTLGQRGINVATFCKDFNERTKDMKEGLPLPCRITVNSDRSYELQINKPMSTYFLKQAAGVQRGAMHQGEEICGKITLKHIYEIAVIKQSDPFLRMESLERICKLLIGTARSCGIQVVKSIDPKEYAEFLEERKKVVEQQLLELKEKKEAKMLRA